MASEETMKAVLAQRAKAASCQHDWKKAGVYRNPPAVIYRCTKCDEEYDKDVS